MMCASIVALALAAPPDAQQKPAEFQVRILQREAPADGPARLKALGQTRLIPQPGEASSLLAGGSLNGRPYGCQLELTPTRLADGSVRVAVLTKFTLRNDVMGPDLEYQKREQLRIMRVGRKSRVVAAALPDGSRVWIEVEVLHSSK